MHMPQLPDSARLVAVQRILYLVKTLQVLDE